MSLADEKEFVKALWYGEPGSAKSTAMATLANRGTLHIVDADGGLKKRALTDLGVNTANIEPYRDIRFSSLDGLFWSLKEELEEDPDSVVGLGMDTTTEVLDRLLGHIVDKEQGRKIEKADRNGLDTDEIDPFFRDRDYYNTLTEQMRRLVRNYKDLPIHLGFTAHVRRDEDEDSGKVQYGPAVTPAVGSMLMGAVDVVAFCRTDGAWPAGYEVAGQQGFDVMVADMRPTSDHFAKDRFHATPRVMVNPTFERLIDYIDGSLTSENDEQQAAYRELWQSRRAVEQEKEAERAARKARRRGQPASGSQAKAAKKTAAAPAGDDANDGDEEVAS